MAYAGLAGSFCAGPGFVQGGFLFYRRRCEPPHSSAQSSKSRLWPPAVAAFTATVVSHGSWVNEMFSFLSHMISVLGRKRVQMTTGVAFFSPAALTPALERPWLLRVVHVSLPLSFPWQRSRLPLRRLPGCLSLARVHCPSFASFDRRS